MSILTSLYLISIGSLFQSLFGSLAKFFSFAGCALADQPLYLKNNKKRCHKIFKSSSTGSALSSKSEEGSSNESDSTLREYSGHLKKGSKMYKILEDGIPVCETNDLATAIKIIQGLESRLDRLVEHSPYTIEKG